MVLVDTNVIVDLFTDDPVWADWSGARLAEAVARGAFINAIVYAELASRFDRQAELDRELAALRLAIVPMSENALFHAGRAFWAYRRAGGPRGRMLADFLIGAHAAALAVPLLTRNGRDFRSYFPDLELIVPD